MEIWYTARHNFGPSHKGWKNYVEFSKLVQAKEIVSLDCGLNDSVFTFDPKNQDDWKYAVRISDNEIFSDCYSSLDYVIEKAKSEAIYNMLAVALNPHENCGELVLENFSFVGYDLLDLSHGNSALTNCGGFPEAFSIQELNTSGLIDDFERAQMIQHMLLETNPEEYHADTNLWAVWRHNFIGRK